MKTAEIVYNLIKNRLSDVELKESTSLSELGLNSLDLVEITFEIEDKFNIEFTSSEITDLETIKDVIDLIDRKTK